MSVRRIEPPSGIGICSTCRWWLVVERVKMVSMPQPQLPGGRAIVTEQQYRASGIIVEKVERFLQAPCVHSPVWVIQPEHGFCGQWSPLPPPERASALTI